MEIFLRSARENFDSARSGCSLTCWNVSAVGGDFDLQAPRSLFFKQSRFREERSVRASTNHAAAAVRRFSQGLSSQKRNGAGEIGRRHPYLSGG